jgi:hypothetical protein
MTIDYYRTDFDSPIHTKTLFKADFTVDFIYCCRLQQIISPRQWHFTPRVLFKVHFRDTACQETENYRKKSVTSESGKCSVNIHKRCKGTENLQPERAKSVTISRAVLTQSDAEPTDTFWHTIFYTPRRKW